MRLLIDGYNLMYAVGLLGRTLGPDGFRKVRHRFLNDLAAALGPVEAHATTVVFDASAPPDGVPRQASHKGITVLYAVGDENADERIERLIAAHSVPKALTVVSSDHRVRQAASRRKAKAVTADAFWSELTAPRRRTSPPAPTPEDVARLDGPSPAEAAYWHEQFKDLESAPETREALHSEPTYLTDDDIAAIEREVEREFEP